MQSGETSLVLKKIFQAHSLHKGWWNTWNSNLGERCSLFSLYTVWPLPFNKYNDNWRWFSVVPVREKLWQENSYCSLNISLKEDDSETESSEEEEDIFSDETTDRTRDIKYLQGDVTHPQNTENRNAIVVHCVGMYSF